MIILLKISTQEGAALLLTFCLWLLKENMGIATSKAAVSNISIERRGRATEIGSIMDHRLLLVRVTIFSKRRQKRIKRQQQILESHEARAGELLLAGWRVTCQIKRVYCTWGRWSRAFIVRREAGRRLWNSETECSLKFRLGNLRPILAVDCVESRRFRVRWFGEFLFFG